MAVLMSIDDVRRMAMTPRIMDLLLSPSARKIDFHLDKVHFIGWLAFSAVLNALGLKQAGGQGINIRFGGLPAGVDAGYVAANNSFIFSHHLYGTNLEERAAIIHEATHAWLDIRVPRIYTPQDALDAMPLMMTTKLIGEAVAYLVGFLFYINETTRTGGSLATPYWAKKENGAQPVYVKGYEIALTISKQKPGYIVPATDVDDLKDAIMLGYPHLKKNPGMLPPNNGL